MFKFNSGDGAVICDQCRTIIKAPADFLDSRVPDYCHHCAKYASPAHALSKFYQRLKTLIKRKTK